MTFLSTIPSTVESVQEIQSLRAFITGGQKHLNLIAVWFLSSFGRKIVGFEEKKDLLLNGW